jgi:hypothetical protein
MAPRFPLVASSVLKKNHKGITTPLFPLVSTNDVKKKHKGGGMAGPFFLLL